MTEPLQINYSPLENVQVEKLEGRLVVFLDESGTMDSVCASVNDHTGGAIARLSKSLVFKDAKNGECMSIAFPSQMQAEAVLVVKLSAKSVADDWRKAGAAIATQRGKTALTVLSGPQIDAHEVAFGLSLMAYSFENHKSKKVDVRNAANFLVANVASAELASLPQKAVTKGVFFTRDLVNEPANILTTDDFAARLAAMRDLGLEVEILEEADLAKLGMGALLGVGQGSPSPSKVVIMRWQNGGEEAPLALIGKGVVFDTGGISIKPAAGMEEMTMDMGGAAVVAGVMRTLALRKAKANVVGLVGIVENMPDGSAQRPGDVVTSMKGDTIEVINTDAEGRLVLADVMWYAQERFKPCGMIDLATLTGAIIIGLGHEMAGVFSNNDVLCEKFLSAAKAEGEGAWRMPVAPAYDKALKSRIADVMNVGGRPGGAITAAMFLQRFVKAETPWIHLDIAGVALVNSETDFAPKGATGWGVRSLDHLIRKHFEQ